MAYSDYYSPIPAYDYGDNPTANYLEQHGLPVGGSTDTRENYVMIEEISFSKIIYYISGNYYQTLIGISDSDYQAFKDTHGTSALPKVARVLFDGASAGTVYTTSGWTQYSYNGDTYWISNVYQQVKSSNYNSHIPIAASQEDAKRALADGNWTPAPPPSTDPYDPSGDGSGYSGGGSAIEGGTGGGYNPNGDGTTGTGGLHDDTSDAIPTPSTPSDVVISSGLFTAYNPDASQLSSFASALWNMQVSDINDVLRFLFGGDAFNAVIGLHLLPVAPSTGGSLSIKLGNWDTGVSAPKISSQYKQVSFGSLLLPEYWGNCIDYAPYTKIQLALPYIGIVDVDTDDVLGSTNTLTYNIDVLSGAICATLHCVKFNLSSVIYQWSGACAVSLPFTGASYNSVLSAIAGIAAAGMGFAAMAAGPIGAALPAAALAAGGGAFGAGSAASIMGTMKGKVQKSGSFGANSGALGIMTPYFILTRPVQSVPETWQADKGYPANISAQLGSLTGYTEVSEINLECSGTEAEKKEIIDLLKKGVLI